MAVALKQMLSLASKILAKSHNYRSNYESKLILSKLINRDLLEIFINPDLKISENKKKIFLKGLQVNHYQKFLAEKNFTLMNFL